MRPIPLLSFLWFGLTHGMFRIPPIKEVSSFGDGATLDVPGSPRVIAVPGHSAGSAALHLPDRDTLFIGDAIVTKAVTTGRTGARLSPFSSDPDQALASLARLEGVEAGLVLPGHGEPWTAGVAAAIDEARATAAEAIGRPPHPVA
jgi:glyoxylase-like metal-dependent hydrolase (beta-lactamase superfamily II)